MGKFTDNLSPGKHLTLKEMLKNNSSQIADGHNIEHLADKWGDWEVVDFSGFNITFGEEVGQIIYFFLKKRNLIVTLAHTIPVTYVNIRSDNNGGISYGKEYSDYSAAKQVYDWSVAKAEETSQRMAPVIH